MMVFLLYVIPVILTYYDGNFQTEVYDGGAGEKFLFLEKHRFCQRESV